MPNDFKNAKRNGITTTETTIYTTPNSLTSILVEMDVANRTNSGLNIDVKLNVPLLTVDAAIQENNDGGPSYVDETADANSSGGADVDPFPATEGVNDSFYIGMENQFEEITFDISTAGDSSGVVVWEYWNGSSWTSLTVNNADIFEAGTGDQVLTFTIPDDWETTTVNSQGPYYFIRARVTTVYTTTNPVLDQVKITKTPFWLVKSVPIPQGSTIKVVDGQKIVTQSDEYISLVCSTGKVDVISSILEDV